MSLEQFFTAYEAISFNEVVGILRFFNNTVNNMFEKNFTILEVLNKCCIWLPIIMAIKWAI
jgi:hypothetical protein